MLILLIIVISILSQYLAIITNSFRIDLDCLACTPALPSVPFQAPLGRRVEERTEHEWPTILAHRLAERALQDRRGILADALAAPQPPPAPLAKAAPPTKAAPPQARASPCGSTDFRLRVHGAPGAQPAGEEPPPPPPTPPLLPQKAKAEGRLEPPPPPAPSRPGGADAAASARGASTLSAAELEALRDAIVATQSLEEVEELQAALQQGKLPYGFQPGVPWRRSVPAGAGAAASSGPGGAGAAASSGSGGAGARAPSRRWGPGAAASPRPGGAGGAASASAEEEGEAQRRKKRDRYRVGSLTGARAEAVPTQAGPVPLGATLKASAAAPQAKVGRFLGALYM